MPFGNASHFFLKNETTCHLGLSFRSQKALQAMIQYLFSAGNLPTGCQYITILNCTTETQWIYHKVDLFQWLNSEVLTWLPKPSQPGGEMDILASPLFLPDSGTLISNWNAKFPFIWKEDFGPLSNCPALFVLSLWGCLQHKSGLTSRTWHL